MTVKKQRLLDVFVGFIVGFACAVFCQIMGWL